MLTERGGVSPARRGNVVGYLAGPTVRILLVSHNVPPHGNAGTETYTRDLARELARRGHAVAVFAAQKDIRRRDGRMLVRRDGEVEVREIVNNLYHARFRGTWDNPRVERAFAQHLRDHRPDVVHFQHLMYLSAGCVGQAKDAGARVVFTLHDYWLTCARLGQRVHSDGGLCATVDFARCGTCLVDHPWTQPWAARAVGPVIAALHESTGVDLSETARRTRAQLTRAAPAPRATGNASGVQDGSRLGAAPAPAPSSASSSAPIPPTPPSSALPAALALAAEASTRWHELRNRVGSRVDLFLAPSRFLRDKFVEEWKLDPHRIEHLPFGFDRTRFSGPRPPSPDGRLRVGFLGTLVPLKGPHVLLEAWNRLPSAVRARGRLVLHGPARHGAAYQDHLLWLARSGGAEIPGPLSREHVAPFLLSTDLLVVPSLWFENSPLSIQEAIACRTPLAASDLGGMAELVVPGVNGLRFPTGDVGALAHLLERALERRAGLETLYAGGALLPTFEEHVDAVVARYRAGSDA